MVPSSSDEDKKKMYELILAKCLWTPGHHAYTQLHMSLFAVALPSLELRPKPVPAGQCPCPQSELSEDMSRSR